MAFLTHLTQRNFVANSPSIAARADALFDPDGNPNAIQPKRPYRRVNHFGAGHLSRLLLDVIRKAERPLTTQEVVEAIVAQLEYGSDAARGMGARIRSSLISLSVEGARLGHQKRRARGRGLIDRRLGLVRVFVDLLPHFRELGDQDLPRDLVFRFAENGVPRKPPKVPPHLRRRRETDDLAFFLIRLLRVGHAARAKIRQ